jgi:hypothetical protein
MEFEFGSGSGSGLKELGILGSWWTDEMDLYKPVRLGDDVQ